MEEKLKEDFYVGISLGFNSSAAIIGTESGVLCAVSQERLNRVKNTKELPFKAIEACLKMAEKQLGYKPVVTKFVSGMMSSRSFSFNVC